LRALAAATSFEALSREWFEQQAGGWPKVYGEKVIASLEIDAFPKIGDRPIAEIEARGVRETAKRVLQRVRAVFQSSQRSPRHRKQ